MTGSAAREVRRPRAARLRILARTNRRSVAVSGRREAVRCLILPWTARGELGSTDEIDHDYAALLMTLTFFVSAKLAAAYCAEMGGRELPDTARMTREAFPDALAEYAHLGRSIQQTLLEADDTRPLFRMVSRACGGPQATGSLVELPIVPSNTSVPGSRVANGQSCLPTV